MKTIFSTCARRFSLTSGDLCLSSLQPRSGGDGNRRLEVDGRLPSAPGGRSLPLAGVRPVPLPRTAPQAPQTILKATKHTLARSLSLTHTHAQTKAPRHTGITSLLDVTYNTTTQNLLYPVFLKKKKRKKRKRRKRGL